MTEARNSTEKPSPQRQLLRAVRRWLVYLLIVYLLIHIMVLPLETGMVYPGIRLQLDESEWQAASTLCEDVQLKASDGTELHGYYVDHPQPVAHILFCHGNYENMATAAPYLVHLRDRFDVAVLAFDYRGYGKSQGRPSEKGIIQDADAAQHWLAQRGGIAANEVVLWGRSLGGGVAVAAAAETGARALILDSTFTSLPDVASYHFPWLFARWLMRNRFDSQSRITRYEGPLIQCHGTADEVIPFRLGKQLFEAATSRDKRFIAMNGNGHNDQNTREFEEAVGEFLKSLPPLD